MYCWGTGGLGLNGNGLADRAAPTVTGTFTDWTHVEVGVWNVCALRRGQLWCWGWNGAGAVGIGTDFGNGNIGDAIFTPTQVGSDSTWTSVATGTGSTTFAGGAEFACATNASGRHCWGLEDGGFAFGTGDMFLLPRVMTLK
jgi:hypothetical protein